MKENRNRRHDDLIPVFDRIVGVAVVLMLWFALVLGIGFVLGMWDM